MEGRSFHTSLVGGFRKKDVISYLTEEKRLQEERVEELRRSQEELEKQLDEARANGDVDRQLNEGLQGELETLWQQLELTRMDLDNMKEAQLLAEEHLTQAEEERRALEARLAAAGEENQTLSAENQALRAELERQKALSRRLKEALDQARPNVKLPADARESESLWDDLAVERQRVAQLESRLRQLVNRKEDTGNADQLWALCGKMERTILQMERMLDGPYRVTCYPAEPIHDKAGATIFEEPAERSEEPVKQPSQPAQTKQGVSSLLQRVRRK